MRLRPQPKTVAAVNASGVVKTLCDPGLYAVGGLLVMEPGVVYQIPIDTFRRGFRIEWLIRAEKYDAMLAAQAAEQEKNATRKGRKKETADADA